MKTLSQGLHEPVPEGGVCGGTGDRLPNPLHKLRSPSSVDEKERQGSEQQRSLQYSNLARFVGRAKLSSHPHLARPRFMSGYSRLGFVEKMEYSALGTTDAADSGAARAYNNSEEREGREPDGLRFDRERARRLWEAVSGAQPVGREEGESGDFRGRKTLARLLLSRRVAEARGGDADQPPGLRSHPLAPGPPPGVMRPGTP